MNDTEVSWVVFTRTRVFDGRGSWGLPQQATATWVTYFQVSRSQRDSWNLKFLRLHEQYSSKQQLNKSVSVIIRKATEKIKTSLAQLKYEISLVMCLLKILFFLFFLSIIILKFQIILN